MQCTSLVLHLHQIWDVICLRPQLLVLNLRLQLLSGVQVCLMLVRSGGSLPCNSQ